MGNRKIVAVVVSTCAQGGGLGRAVLADSFGNFACRAVTRDPRKERAKDLAAKGADVVAVDLDDVESLKGRSWGPKD